MTARAVKLCGEMVARTERRNADQRSEPRREDIVDCSTLFFRGGVHLVPVVNISSRGAMVVSDIEPRIGENVIIRFEGCSPVYAAVRWVRGGRVGLGFGSELLIG
jgi:hypothetical protein